MKKYTVHPGQLSQSKHSGRAALVKELKIKLVHGPSFNAKSNFTERSHKDLNAMLRAVCIQNPNQDWEEQLRSCVHALNTSRNRHTGMTAFYLMFGRECHTPLDHIFGNIPNEPEERPHEAALRLRQRQQAAYRFVRENLQRAVERTSATYSLFAYSSYLSNTC